MKKEFQLTFDKSAAEFVLSSFGYKVDEHTDTIWDRKSKKTLAKCCNCGLEVELDEVAGIINFKGEPRLVCTGIECVLQVSEYLKGLK